MAIFGTIVLVLGILIVGYLVYTAKKSTGLIKDDEFMDRSDDLENDFGSMAFSVVFTMFIRFLLTGHHPDDDETDFDHTQSQRTKMLMYALFCLVVASFATRYFANKATDAANADNYTMKRVYNFLTTVTAMNVAWAFLYWGEWEFFESLYPGEAIKGRVMFAIVMTMFCGLALLGLSKMSGNDAQMNAGCKGAEQVSITAVSLLVAWSWELCFDAAVEDMTEGVSHPAGWKVAATLTLMAVVVPVYANYVKPAVKRNGADG
jgi:Ca2+/Na+ antiporter